MHLFGFWIRAFVCSGWWSPGCRGSLIFQCSKGQGSKDWRGLEREIVRAGLVAAVFKIEKPWKIEEPRQPREASPRANKQTNSKNPKHWKIKEPREASPNTSQKSKNLENLRNHRPAQTRRFKTPKRWKNQESTKKYHNKIVCKKGRETKVRSKIIIQKNTRFDSVEFSVCMCVLAEGLLAGLAPLDFVRDLVAPSLVLQMIFFRIFFSQSHSKCLVLCKTKLWEMNS